MGLVRGAPPHPDYPRVSAESRARSQAISLLLEARQYALNEMQAGTIDLRKLRYHWVSPWDACGFAFDVCTGAIQQLQQPE